LPSSKDRYEGLEFDEYVARFYLNKIKSSKDRKLEFSLTLTEVKNILRAKYCQLTGVPLTHTGASDSTSNSMSSSGQQRYSDLTIDRIDNNLGYVKGNVLACCYGANHIKSLIEGNLHLVSMGMTPVEFIHTISYNLSKRGF
jgi:hypothetical protein